MGKFKKGDKVKVISNTKSHLAFDSIGWEGTIYAANYNIGDGRIDVLFSTGFLNRDEIWLVHPDDMELVGSCYDDLYDDPSFES